MSCGQYWNFGVPEGRRQRGCADQTRGRSYVRGQREQNRVCICTIDIRTVDVRCRTDGRSGGGDSICMMLHEFLTLNRKTLISRCREKVAKRFEPDGTLATIDHGVPLFLQQLVETLRDEQNTLIRDVDSEPTPATTEIGRAAALH